MEERERNLDQEIETKLDSAEQEDDAARLDALEDVHSTLESELEASGDSPPTGH